VKEKGGRRLISHVSANQSVTGQLQNTVSHTSLRMMAETCVRRGLNAYLLKMMAASGC